MLSTNQLLWRPVACERLLIERGDTRIKRRPQHFRSFMQVAKNVLRFCVAGSAFYGHFRVMIWLAEDHPFRPSHEPK